MRPSPDFLGASALALILFAGRLDTSWRDVHPVLGQGLALATLRVLVTAGAFGAFAPFSHGLCPVEGLLLGSIVSSTDPAAVFPSCAPGTSASRDGSSRYSSWNLTAATRWPRS
jgi:NhaP-type Na+/H+ and K+/H+ antiporter